MTPPPPPTNTDFLSVLHWLVCQSTQTRFTLPAQIWWACSHLFIRSQSDLNGRHNKHSHIWAGSWNPACVDTPISVEPSVRPHLTQIWLPQRCPNTSNTWGGSPMEQNVCRAESCIQIMIHRIGGGLYSSIYLSTHSPRQTDRQTDRWIEKKTCENRAEWKKRRKGRQEERHTLSLSSVSIQTDCDSSVLLDCCDALWGFRGRGPQRLVFWCHWRRRDASLSFLCAQWWNTTSRPVWPQMDLFGELKWWFVLPQRAPARVARSEPLDASSFLIYSPSEAANVDFQQNVWLMGELCSGLCYTVGMYVWL